MLADEAFVDTQVHKRVLDVREGWAAAPVPRRDSRRRRRGRPFPDHLVVAVRIRGETGTMVWTTFAKGPLQFMSIAHNIVEV